MITIVHGTGSGRALFAAAVRIAIGRFRTGLPARPGDGSSLREWKRKADLCGACHTDIVKTAADVHFTKIAEGTSTRRTDCRLPCGAAAQRMRQRISETQRLPPAINEQYALACMGCLAGRRQPGCAVCIDCHGVRHRPADPQFKPNSPKLCAECHADES